MSGNERMESRIRWHCRRGMLELDLVLNAFVERHLANLDSASLDAFKSLLERTDPELLDLVMGREEALGPDEEKVLELVRGATRRGHGIPTVTS